MPGTQFIMVHLKFRQDQKPRLAKIAAIRGTIQNFAAGAEFREICDCRDRRGKIYSLTDNTSTVQHSTMALN